MDRHKLQVYGKWNWNKLSINPKVTPDIIKRNPNLPWNWRGLHLNPNFAENIVSHTTFESSAFKKDYSYNDIIDHGCTGIGTGGC